MARALCVTAAAVAAVLSRPSLADDDWASFQNGGRCVLLESDLPLQWSPGEGIAWSVELKGSGQSSPIVWKDRVCVYVTFASGAMKDRLHVRALRLDSGETLWEHEEANRSPEKDSGYVSRAAPTPVADANGVIAFFEGGNLVALKHDGGVRWRLDLARTTERSPLDMVSPRRSNRTRRASSSGWSERTSRICCGSRRRRARRSGVGNLRQHLGIPGTFLGHRDRDRLFVDVQTDAA